MGNSTFSLVNIFREHIPVDVDGLAAALGIKVVYCSLDPDISGMIERDESGEYIISVNENDSKTRQRFTLAHEIGHFIYHKDKMGDGIDDDRFYRSTDAGKYHNTKIGRREEAQANRFAANLLMPYASIKKLQEEEKLSSPADLAKRLLVSEHAMCVRLNIPYTKK